ncbi:MAG: sulfotransferase family 2 domain-containing protein [Anaerolineae bacterium]|nr:sulfotransferase family 2 domain-containing protein [Anaerolineae bacterium]
MNTPLPKTMLKDEDQLFFLHIPKTAGTTLGSILSQHFTEDQIFDFNRGEEARARFFTLPPERLAHYKVFKGHCYYDAMRKTLSRQPICLTLLRHPLDQIISHYWHLHTMPDNPAHKRVSRASLEEFVFHPEFSNFVANIHTRFIGATLNADAFPSASAYQQATVLEVHTHGQYHQVDTLARAKERLAEFAVVGLTERFQDTLYLLAYTFGWFPKMKPLHRNVAVERPAVDAISAQVQAQISAISALDLALYHHAAALFEARFLQMTQNLLEWYGDQHDAALPYPLPGDVMKRLLDQHARQYVAEPSPQTVFPRYTVAADEEHSQPQSSISPPTKPLAGRRALIIIPGTVSYFYDAEGRRVAEALQDLGCEVAVHTLTTYPEGSYDWCFLMNLSEIVHAHGNNMRVVMRHVQQLKVHCRQVGMILLESVRSPWFRDSLSLMQQAKLTILLDLGFYNQYQHASRQAQKVYHFVFNGLTRSEKETICESGFILGERPLPWTFVGHLVPRRLKLLQRLIEDVDRRGFVYMVHFTPVTETGPHLNQAQLHEVLLRTRYKVWCSHVDHPYVESIRFRLALMAGAVPIKIHMQPFDIAEPLPFSNLMLDEHDFDMKLRAMHFEETQYNFVREFNALPLLETGLLEVLTQLG